MPSPPKKLFGVDVPDGLEPIVIVLDNSDDGLVRFRQDDILDEILDTLGDHAARITKEAGNEPRLKIGSVEITTRTASGNPAGLGPSHGAESTFEDTFSSPESEVAVAHFDQSSNSQLLPLQIRKGKTDDKSIPSGLELIEEVNTLGKNSSIAKAINKVQVANNRYASEATFINPDSREQEDDTDVGAVILQETLGKHAPRTWPDMVGDGKDIKLNIRRLKNIGLQSLLEASGEYYVPDDTDDFASVVAAKAASSAPGLARLGVRIPVSRFSPAVIAQNVIPDFRKVSNFPELAGPERYSHGSVNNPLVPFSAVSSTSAGIAAVLLTITVSTMVRALAAVLAPDPQTTFATPNLMGSAFGADGKSTQDKEQIRKNRIGSYFGKANDPVRDSSSSPIPGALGLFTGNFFILQQTQAPYSKAVSRGSEIFFGQFNSLGGLIGAAFGAGGNTFKHVSENPGYYNVLLRMLIKSVTESVGDVVNSVVGLGGLSGESSPVAGTVLGKSALDIDKDIGLENDPTNLLNVVNSIRDSKMLKFMDILAVLGDISLMSDNGNGASGLFESSIDGVRDFTTEEGSFPNPAALIKKNRLSSRVGGKYPDSMAWGSNTLRSLYILPSSLGRAEKQFKGDSPVYEQLKSWTNTKDTTNNRISQEDVLAIETELDAYYVPFYFHDLRTNEIISFHSFIESITDSHDAEYTETTGFGRIGKVHTYKNTNRSIQCSFKVVATNRTDFSEMWYKINKLVLMLYPQYTAGRPVSYAGADGEEKKFIQPFSQLIGNSPMIRMRLGDLIKTNFSDFDLARMFGVGTDKFKLTSTLADRNAAREEKIAQAIATIMTRMYSGDFDNGDEFFYSEVEFVGSRRGISGTIFSDVQLPARGLYRVDYLDVDPKKYGIVLKSAADDDEFSNTFDIDLNQSSEYEIEPYMPFVRRKAEDQVGPAAEVADAAEILRKTQEFFDPENNPIVKSFDSVKGQGLAGFIKRLSFDWADANWDTEGLNNRAPMWMKVDLEFSPVNDINPGLDSSGAPIGMPYNIGSILNLLKMRRASDTSAGVQEGVYAAAKQLAATPTNGSAADKGLSLTDPLGKLSVNDF